MALTQEWFTTVEVAALALPGVPTSPANVIEMAKREHWRQPEWLGKRWRKRAGSGGGIEYHWQVLPPDARLQWSIIHTVTDAEAARRAAEETAHGRALWAGYNKLSDKQKEECERRKAALDQLRQVASTGRKKMRARAEVARAFEVSPSTLSNWEATVCGQPEHLWLPLLAPGHKGRTARVEYSEKAWNLTYVLYARQGNPRFHDCYLEVVRVGKKENWAVPSEATLWRRMQKVPPETLAHARKGKQAVKRMFPAQRRDPTVFHALQAVNADGHKWDVHVRWPDGKVGRPMMLCFQDVYSGKILAWRIDRSENLYMVQLTLGDVIETFGVPEHCYLDNGRGFTAKALTGGIKNRYRYKYNDAEPDGIMKRLGIEVHFTHPYSGQSKPIERAFGDFADEIAKDIRFEGAYCGNSPGSRPEDFDPKKAVPLELFLKVVAEGIRRHNARDGRRTKACGGKLSFDDAFKTSYEVSEIRKAPPEQKLLWLLAARQIKPRMPDGVIHFYENRYFAKFLQPYMGKALTVRFDPDNLKAGLHVDDVAGHYLGLAECIEDTGFNSTTAAEETHRKRAEYARAAKAVHAIETGGMTREEAIALIDRETEPPPLPESKVVRIARVNGSLAISTEAAQLDAEETEDMLVRASEARRAHRLRLVGEDDGD